MGNRSEKAALEAVCRLKRVYFVGRAQQLRIFERQAKLLSNRRKECEVFFDTAITATITDEQNPQDGVAGSQRNRHQVIEANAVQCIADGWFIAIIRADHQNGTPDNDTSGYHLHSF